ncbi:LysR substrate-binding domain-containing protein [Marinivivus vitaminiproducens]|uniref:LysR substrate-binding domain-containing protein n=1 Tax=Marinivivus vitaminiproducens TaxID=3035935 RepID=UPI0027A6813A|nr:LysR substrate-binding domain-containing protein [Geminicoccaceae bacterium SCSIO 64248]
MLTSHLLAARNYARATEINQMNCVDVAFNKTEEGSNMMPLQNDLLATFVAIAESGSFAAAAERVRRSPSAVSMQIKRLESEIGRALFVRRPNAAVLTPAGERLVPHAHRLLRMHEEMWADVASGTIADVVILGSPDDYADTLLPPILTGFAAVFPEVEVQLVCESSTRLYELTDSNAVDLALVTRHPTRPELPVVRQERQVWVSEHQFDWIGRDTLPLAMFQPGCLTRQVATAALDRAGRRHHVAYSSASLAGLLTAVRSGRAITALPECSVPQYLRVLEHHDGLPRLPPLELAVAQASATARPAVRALTEQIVGSLSEPAEADNLIQLYEKQSLSA